MKTTKRTALLPGIFFILTALLEAYNFIRLHGMSGHWNFWGLFRFALLSAIAVLLLAVKKKLPLSVCTAIFMLLHLFSLFSLSFFDIAYILLYLSSFGVWGLLTLMLLIDSLPTLEAWKSKKTLLRRISLIVFIILAATTLVITFVYHSTLLGNTMFIEVFLTNVLPPVAILTMLLWLAPAPKKDPVVNGSAPDATPTASPNEFYVSTGKHVCLLLFTFGIWLLIWIYKATKFSNFVANEAPSNPAGKLLLCMFVPFYQIYWTYKTATRIDKIAKQNEQFSDLATVCLILAIFVPIIPPILMQDKINQIITNA